MHRQHRAAQPAGRRVVMQQVGARLRGRGIALHFGVQLEIVARAVRTCAVIDEVPGIKGVAACALLQILYDERPVRDIVSQVRVRVQPGEVAHGHRRSRIRSQRLQHLVAIGDRVLEAGRDRH